MKEIFTKKNKLERKLVGAYSYHNLTINAFLDPDRTASVWIEYPDHSDIIYKFNNIGSKKALKKRLKKVSSDLVSTLNDSFCNSPMTDEEFENYIWDMMPYMKERDKDI